MNNYDIQKQESQCTKDAQTLALVYIQGGQEGYQARHDELMRGRKIKDFEHAILIDRIKNLFMSNGIIIKRTRTVRQRCAEQIRNNLAVLKHTNQGVNNHAS